LSAVTQEARWKSSTCDNGSSSLTSSSTSGGSTCAAHSGPPTALSSTEMLLRAQARRWWGARDISAASLRAQYLPHAAPTPFNQKVLLSHCMTVWTEDTRFA
jgi:hypothetical protein